MAYTRHQLKQDKFAETVAEQVSWVVQHQKSLATGAIVAVVVVAALAGAWIYYNQRDQAAAVDLGAALRTYTAAIQPPNAPKTTTGPTYASAKERAEAARIAFQHVEDKYPHTRAAEISRYFVGVTSLDMGDTASAEKVLGKVAGSRDRELAALGKFALASTYRAQNKDSEAIKLYQDLMAHPTTTVPKTTAELELAFLYQQKQPDEASKLYQQIQKEEPGSPAAQTASQRLASLKPASP